MYIMEVKPNLYINAEKIIVNLFNKEKSYYIDIPRFYKLCDFIKVQLIENNCFDTYASVFMDADFDAINRTIKYNNQIFDLVDNRIYLKGELPSEYMKRYNIETILNDIIEKFIAQIVLI